MAAQLGARIGLASSGSSLDATADERALFAQAKALAKDMELAALAVETLAGTGALLEQTGEHPAQVRERVTSPGGTTLAGLTVLEQRGVRAALIDAVVAAAARARELGQGPAGR